MSLKSRVTASATVVALALTFTIATPVVSPASAAPSVSSTITLPANSAPESIAISPDGTKAYIANNSSTTNLTVISTADNTLGTPIDLGQAFNLSVAFSPDGSKAFVVGPDSPMKVVSVATNAVVDSIDKGIAPYSTQVAFSPNGSKAYVASRLEEGGFFDSNTYVLSFSGVTNQMVGYARTSLPTPISVAVSPDSTKVYAGCEDGTLMVFDTSTDLDIATINLPTGSVPTSIAFTPDGSKAFVANSINDSVSVINVATSSVASTITLPSGSSPVSVAVTPDGSSAFVANSSSDTISIIEVASGTVTSTLSLPAGSGPRSVAITPDGTRAYIANGLTSTVSVITIKGITSAPRQLKSGVRTGTSVVLRWWAPEDLDGGVITDYLIQYRPFGTTTWLTFAHTASPARKLTVTGLSTRTKYEFQLAATTSAGTSDFSTTVTATTRRR